MASALAARIRAALAPLDQPGEAIDVSPFRAGEVSGGAIALKGIAALMAGRRGAANARQRQEKAQADANYRALLTQQLQQKLSEPEEQTFEYELPDKTKVRGTPKWYAEHYPTFHPKAAEGDARVHIPQSDATRLGIPWDPETGTALERDVRANRQRVTSEDVTTRLGTAIEDRQGRERALGEAKSFHDLLAGLEGDEKRASDDARAKAMQDAAGFRAALLDATQHPRVRSAAAFALGIRPAVDAKGNPQRAPDGRLLFDTEDLDQRIKDYVERTAADAGLRARSTSAQTRALYQQRLRKALSGFGVPDPGVGVPADDDFLTRLREGLSGYGAAPEDTTWYDRPAE